MPTPKHWSRRSSTHYVRAATPSCALRMGWPDVVIAFAVGLGVLGGWWRGLIGEVISLLAWIVSISMGFLYQGQFDHDMMHRFHVGPGPAHAFGMAAFGAVAYAVIFGVG